MNQEQLDVRNIEPIIHEKVKVPVVKIDLYDEIVTGVDIVVNNPEGVQNS